MGKEKKDFLLKFLENGVSELTTKENQKKFSVFTLVNEYEEYSNMLDSFYSAGFTNSNTDFYYIDNVEENIFDAYQALNLFLANAENEYLICCHQDIRVSFDNKYHLEKKLEELTLIDSKWAIAGNAGGSNNFSQIHQRITDPTGFDKNSGKFPQRVNSLDENFLIIKNRMNIGVSMDLNGFHLYGTDICIQANLRGFSCYVIDFHLNHLSRGKINKDFLECKRNLVSKYQKAYSDKFIRTTCSLLFISSSKIRLFLINNYVALRIKKLFDTYLKFK